MKHFAIFVSILSILTSVIVLLYNSNKLPISFCGTDSLKMFESTVKLNVTDESLYKRNKTF